MRTRTEFDLLASLHKALRSCIFDVLVEVGRVDASDGDALRRTALRVQRLLALLREPPGALHRAVAQLQRGPLAQRADAAQELYQALSHWSIGMLQKLALDEQQQAARPAAAPAQRQRQLASLSDAELSEALQWLGRALNPQELAALLADLQQAGDGARFGHALQALGEHLDAARWDQLARAMELPQVTLPERLALAA
jgi:hypothetical protein